MIRTAFEDAIELLEKACASVENQANWDKKPYSEWYYKAKILIAEYKQKLKEYD